MEQKILQEKRKYYNAKILSYIGYMLNKYPDLRFTQLLYDLGVDNINTRYNEEPWITYAKIQKIKI